MPAFDHQLPAIFLKLSDIGTRHRKSTVAVTIAAILAAPRTVGFRSSVLRIALERHAATLTTTGLHAFSSMGEGWLNN